MKPSTFTCRRLCRKGKNEAVDIHMPAASKNVNLKHNTMQKNKNVSRHHDGVYLLSNVT